MPISSLPAFHGTYVTFKQYCSYTIPPCKTPLRHPPGGAAAPTRWSSGTPQAGHAKVIRVTRTLCTTCHIVKPLYPVLYSHIVRTDFPMAASPAGDPNNHTLKTLTHYLLTFKEISSTTNFVKLPVFLKMKCDCLHHTQIN